jgi:hypothetical protein
MEATMAKAIHKPEDETPDDEPWTREAAEQRMHEPLASLPPPTPIEGLARQQDVPLPQRWEDLVPEWPEGEWDDEEDFDVIRERWRAQEIEIMKRKLAERPPTGLNPEDDYETFEREQWTQEIAAWEREHGESPDSSTNA